jgi:DNA-binding NtrC family response regulator
MDDIPLLVAHFLQSKTSSRSGNRVQVTRQAMEVLCAYGWPGNVRELENAIERAVTLCEKDLVRVSDLPPSILQKVNIPATAEEHQDTVHLPEVAEAGIFPLKMDSAGGSQGGPQPGMQEPVKPLKNFLRDQEIAYLNRALEQAGGDKEQAALALGVSLATLYRKLAGEGDS